MYSTFLDQVHVHSVKSGKTNDLQVFGSKLYKEPKQDSQNQLHVRLPMSEDRTAKISYMSGYLCLRTGQPKSVTCQVTCTLGRLTLDNK